jgi:methanogenic corrinoid protein MtbC1
VLGLSVTLGAHVTQLHADIARLREANPDTPILIGGRVVDKCPGLAEEVGAEASADGCADAVRWAEETVG